MTDHMLELTQREAAIIAVALYNLERAYQDPATVELRAKVNTWLRNRQPEENHNAEPDA